MRSDRHLLKKNHIKIEWEIAFKKLFIVLLVPFSIVTIINIHDGDVKEKKIDNDWTYSGKIQKNKFVDEGVLDIKDIGQYKGTFEDGKFSGKGVFQSKQGWSFEGIFKDGETVKAQKIRLKNGDVWTKQDGKWSKLKK
ncbi:MAG: hypothetical protein PUI85_05230 [Eubacteriales bacterium]|nr:hypothetical protein [Eubacteriales bacterium]MDY3332502.1 hypothetical protein [Gallibacter sp.]